MGALFTYTFYSGIFLLAGFLTYRWLLAKENQAKFNRFLILTIFFLSFLAYPFSLVEIGIKEVEAIGGTEIGMLSVTDVVQEALPLWPVIILWLWLAGVVAVAAWTLIVFARLIGIISKGKHIRYKDVVLVILKDAKVAPFSWGRYIVATESDLAASRGMIEIHELAHIRHRHWLDLILAQLVCIILWYNPAAWLMREELKLVHEYQADDCVLASGTDAKTYQMLLIRKAVGTRFESLANSLNHSKLKQRITMMYSKKSSSGRRLRALAVVPALALAFMVTNLPFVATAMSKTSRTGLIIGKVTQNPDSPQAVGVIAKEKIEISGMPDVMPSFPGGDSELYKYLATTIVYPKTAQESGAQGRVVVGFTVQADGSIADLKVIKGVSADLDEEALRVAASMPKWIPAKKDGQNVAVSYALPVSFKLTGDEQRVSAEMKNRATLNEAVVVAYGGGNSSDDMNKVIDGKPSIMIDGKIYDGVINEINPETIESMTVRKNLPEYPNGLIEIKLKK